MLKLPDIARRRLVDTPARENVEQAEQRFKRAIELDPEFAGAYAGLSFNHSVKARFRFSDSPELEKKRSLEYATKAIEIDNRLAWGHVALGGAYLANGDPDLAIEAVRHALVIEPNSYEANLFMGLYLQFAGQPTLAVKHLEIAQRLNPVDTVRKLSFLGMAYFMDGNYAASASTWKRRMEKFPVGNEIGFVFLAGSYAMLGEMEQATSTTKALLKKKPDFNLANWNWVRSYKNPEDREHLFAAAIKAGIPKGPVD